MKTLVNCRMEKNIVEGVLNVLSNLRRWSLHSGSSDYTELAKQGLNITISYVVAITARENGCNVIMERFPWIAMKRMIQKTINGDIRDDHIDEICCLAGIERKKFDQLVNNHIIKNMSNFEEKLQIDENCFETRIFKAATKLGTLVEFNGLGNDDPKSKKEILKFLNEFMDIPGFRDLADENSEVFKFLEDISNLRFSVRWAKRFKAKDCSVLEHLAETAILAWLASLENNPEDEKTATHMFWCGAFHDLPERWTGDMASPIKDAIPGLREGTEKFEMQVMNERVYKKLPSYLGEAIRDIMMEEDKNHNYKSLLKSADYMSAILECYRNIICGSRDKYFLEVIKNEKKKKSYSPIFKKITENIYRELR